MSNKKNATNQYILNVSKTERVLDIVLKSKEIVFIVAGVVVSFANIFLAIKLRPVEQSIAQLTSIVQAQAKTEEELKLEHQNLVSKDTFSELSKNVQETHDDVRELRDVLLHRK